MKPEKRLGYLCLFLGVILLVAMGAMIFRNIREDRAAAQAAREALEILQIDMPTRTTAPTTGEPAQTDPTDPPSLSSEILEGHEYVGYLIFPSLDRTLPIIKIKYVEDLKIAPCLEKGSPWTDDAVISAHNYPSHFGPIRSWTGGEEVIFSSLEGQQIRYAVSLVQTVKGTDVDTVMESDYDLVLYTCTPGGAKRVMVACNRTEE